MFVECENYNANLKFFQENFSKKSPIDIIFSEFYSDFDELMSKPIAIFEICLDKFGKKR